MTAARSTFRAIFDRFAGVDAPAYYHIGGDLTYAALHEQALFLARRLAAHAPAHAPVVLFGHKHSSYQVAWWACLLSGRALIPVEMDTPMARLAAITRSCGARLVLLTEPDTDILDLEGADVWPLHALPPGPEAPVRPELADSDVAYVMYSSGSTSQPKGIRITYANLADFVLWLQSALLADIAFEAVSGNVRHCFDVSLFELWAAWLRLKPVSGLDHSEFMNSRKYIERYARHRVGLWVSTPSTVQSYLKDPQFNAANLPALGTFLFCGEVLGKRVVQLLRDRFPCARVINTYGPTECTVAVTSVTIRPEHLASLQPLPIGAARPGCELRLEDGQIVISGKCVGTGYIGLPEKQAAAFPVFGTYRTGDNGYEGEDGLWYFGGRMDREIKLLGMRMDLSDIEAEILRIEGVQSAFVEPVEVQGICRALRAFVFGPEDQASLSEIARKTAEILPPAMAPKFWHLCSELVLNFNSKIDKPRMIRAALDRGADFVHVSGKGGAAILPPRQAVEAAALDSLGFMKVAETAIRRQGPMVTLAMPRGGRELTVLAKAAHVRFWRENEQLFVKDHNVVGSGAEAMRSVLGKTLQTSSLAEGWAEMRDEMVSLLSSTKQWFQRPLAEATARLASDLQSSPARPVQKLCLNWATRAICDPLFGNPKLESDAWDLLGELDENLFERMAALPSERSAAELAMRVDEAMRRIAAGAGSATIAEAILAGLGYAGGLEDRMRRIVAGLLTASVHMNGMTLFWALRHLADAPDLQRRIGEEGQSFGVGPRRVAQTPLAFATLRETLRMKPVTAFVERQVAEPFVLDSRTFHPGQSVLFSPLLVHMDPEEWPEPARFDPERFLGGRPVPKDGYLPFGIGDRVCPGASVVNAQLTYALSVLCQSVRLSLAPETRLGDLRPMFRIVLEPKGAIHLHATPVKLAALETEGA